MKKCNCILGIGYVYMKEFDGYFIRTITKDIEKDVQEWVEKGVKCPICGNKLIGKKK